MNRNNPSMEEACFDRLVDGELGEKERHELLTGLDSEPDGWRRCALAFLEAQAWKESLGEMAVARKSAASPAPKPPASRRRWVNRLGTVLAMAASFVAAVWIVSWTRRDHVGGPGASDVASIRQPLTTPNDNPSVGASVAPSSPWQLVTLGTPGSQRSIRLPAVEGNGANSEWLRSLPSGIPDEVLGALARTGHQVEQHRQLVPVPLQDGRRLVVPVDQVEVHYTGNQTY